VTNRETNRRQRRRAARENRRRQQSALDERGELSSAIRTARGEKQWSDLGEDRRRQAARTTE
jgi:hypothetical protein